MPIKIAFAGTGPINRVHANAARKAGAQLAAVVNHHPESMAKFAAEFDIPRQYALIDELLKDGGIDALVVSTPNYLHAAQTIAALDAGLHVLVEKPMAINADEAGAMYAAAQRSGRILLVAHCFRFDPETIWLRGQIASGRIGRIIRTKGYGVHVNWGPAGWFSQKKFAGGGALADVGIHALDTARFLLGDPLPVSVYARISTNYGDYDVDDTGLILVNWDNGCSSYFESGWRQPHADQSTAGTQLYGQSGFASLFPTTIHVSNASHAGQVAFMGGDTASAGDAGMIKYQAQMNYFIERLEHGQAPVPGGLDGWVNMRVVDAAYESGRSGLVVEVG